jgi:hypothetical protein
MGLCVRESVLFLEKDNLEIAMRCGLFVEGINVESDLKKYKENKSIETDKMSLG